MNCREILAFVGFGGCNSFWGPADVSLGKRGATGGMMIGWEDDNGSWEGVVIE